MIYTSAVVVLDANELTIVQDLQLANKQKSTIEKDGFNRHMTEEVLPHW